MTSTGTQYLRNTISLTGLNGIEQDERHSARSERGNRRPAAYRIRIPPTYWPSSSESSPTPQFISRFCSSRRLRSKVRSTRISFHAVERAAHDRDPNVFVTTPMLTGATDRPSYQKVGIKTYGFDMFKVDKAENRGASTATTSGCPWKTSASGCTTSTTFCATCSSCDCGPTVASSCAGR